MNCKTVSERIYSFIDGQLTEEEAQAFLAHIEECPSCAALFADAQILDGLIAETIVPVEPPVGFADAVMACLPQAKIVPFPSQKSKFFKWGAFVAAAAIALSFGLTNIFSNNAAQPGINLAENLSNNEQIVNEREPGLEITVTDPATENNEGNTESQTPDVVAQNSASNKEDNQTGSSSIGLPKAASGTQGVGNFNQRLLAAHQGVDTLNPEVNSTGKYVTYYVKLDGKLQLWQVALSGDTEPVLLSEEDLAENEGLIQAHKYGEWKADNYDNCGLFAAASDGSRGAISSPMDGGSLWLTDANGANAQAFYAKGGGNIILWAPNNGSFVFNDNQNNLYVAYPEEGIVLYVLSGNVKNLSWADSKNLVLEIVEPSASNSAVYVVTLP